jgi:hypothetical protein
MDLKHVIQKNSLILLFLAAKMLGCTEGSTNRSKVSIIEIPSNEVSGNFSKNFTLSHIVPLETTEYSYISEIKKIAINNFGIFILDNNKRILHFTENGNFIKHFSQIGKGPGEWNEIFDFEVNPFDSTIIIRSQHKELIYTTKGSFVKESHTDLLALEFYTISKDLTAFYYNSISHKLKSGYNIIVRDKNGRDKHYSKSIKPLDGYIFKTKYSRNFCQTNEGMLFTKTFNDTIFLLDSISVFAPKYKIDFGFKKYATERIKDAQLVSELDNEFANYISNIYETSQILYFEYLDANLPTRVVYDKISRKVVLKERIKPDMANNIPLNFINYYGNINYALSVIEPSDILEFLDYNAVNIESLKYPEIKQIKDTDNPLLVFYTINSIYEK